MDKRPFTKGHAMKSNRLLQVLLAIIAVCLVKIAFLPGEKDVRLVPEAHAGGILEWKEALRIVTSSDNGAVTYVWDYEGQTRVRKYSIDGDSLRLTSYYLKSK